VSDVNAIDERDNGAGAPAPALEVRASILMGIDYKSFRRAQSIEIADDSGRRFYSSLNLAEWVVLVEGVDRTGSPCTVAWEMVYDASSGTRPRLQVARYLDLAVAINPARPDALDATLVTGAPYAPVEVPKRVGKVNLQE
jgi:hypothetical protein